MSNYTQIKLYALLLVASLFLIAQPAFATKRVALVLGNATYQNAPCSPTRPTTPAPSLRR